MGAYHKGVVVDPDLFKRAKAELAEATGFGEWKIVVFHIHETPGEHELLARGGDDPVEHLDECFHAMIEEAITLHAPVVADVTAVPVPQDCSESIGGLRSVCAVPVFDPEVFHPDFRLRPLIGVAVFATGVPATDVVENADVHAIYERYAEEGVQSLLTRT